jgi:hypothetical protein
MTITERPFQNPQFPATQLEVSVEKIRQVKSQQKLTPANLLDGSCANTLLLTERTKSQNLLAR